MAKIAVELESITAAPRRAAELGGPASRILSCGNGWMVEDVVCTAGPRDRPFEEHHAQACVAIVMEGTFQYRSRAGRALMVPGSLFLGNAGQHFECSHEHGVGDRCLSFHYDADYFEGLAADAGAPRAMRRFPLPCVPPVRDLAAVVARGCAGLAEPGSVAWEELSIELATRAIRCANGDLVLAGSSSLASEARVSRIARMIEREPDAPHELSALAAEAGLSRYHFLRKFAQLTGSTPHQYILRARLRRAATRLALENKPVVEVALDCGFGDVSNFNHAFRAEFGMSPRKYRGKCGIWKGSEEQGLN